MIFADQLIKETLRGYKADLGMTKRSLEDIRQSMKVARVFVLDDRMSAFLADLSQVPFHIASVRRGAVLDSMRHGALLPFPKVWIEYDARAFRTRLLELNPDTEDPWGNRLQPVSKFDPDGIPDRWGFLIEQHPQIPEVIKMQGFCRYVTEGIYGMPFAVVWNSKDEPLPWNNVDLTGGMMAHGITGFLDPHIGVVHEEEIRPEHRVAVHIKGRESTHTHFIVAEFGGIARYALAFLSTLNDVPSLKTEVKPQRGYIARGQRRKFVDYTSIRLNIPQTVDYKRLARKVFAHARKRWHEVRSHWRLYQRGRGGILCAPNDHLWGPKDDNGHARCTQCTAWRTWIVIPEGRGDATLGVNLHQYDVTHSKEARQ